MQKVLSWQKLFMLFVTLLAAGLFYTDAYAVDSKSLVTIVKPANGATVSTGDNDLYLSCVNVNANGGFSVSQATLYTPVKLQVLKGETLITDTSISMSALNFTSDGVKVGKVNLPDSGTYTIKVQAPGSSDVWDSVTVTAKEGSSDPEATGTSIGTIASFEKSGYLNSTVTASTEIFRDFNFDETKNPGFHLNFKQSEYTIDLNGDNTAKIEYYVTVPDGYKDFNTGGSDFSVCDDAGVTGYLKWKDYDYQECSCEGYSTYTGLKTGKLSVHFWILYKGVYQHHEIKINIIDSSKDSGAKEDLTPTPAANVTPAAKGQPVAQNGLKYQVTSSNKTSPQVAFTGVSSAKKTSAAIPDTVVSDGVTYKVTSVADNAFKNNTTLKTVSIGKNVTSIGKNAFYGCTALTKVTGCASVTSIGSKAFYKCSALYQIGSKSKVITLAKIKTIGTYAFYNCKALLTVNLSSTVLTKIDKCAFCNCTKLKSFTVKSTKLKTVGAKAFYKVKSGCAFKITKKVTATQYKTYQKLIKTTGKATSPKFSKV